MEKILKKRLGFTLLETVLVIAIIGILTAAVTPIAVSWVGAYNATLNTSVTLDKLRYATERMARELREVRSTSSGYQFSTMGASSLAFTQDTTGRTVTIAQSGTNITLSYSDVAGVTPVLTDQVSSLVFRYFKQDGATETTDQALVRYVEISLALLQGTQTYSQRTRVRLRNL